MNKIYVRQITKFLPVYFIIIALIVLTSTSFALLRNNQVGTNAYTMNAGNLEVTFKDQETDALTVSNMYPMTDEEGLAQTDELTFVVKNTGNVPAVYNVYIEETSTNPAFKTVIRYVDKKNNGNYSDIKVLNDNKYIDTIASLNVGEEATYKVKLWLAEEADSTYMNKTFRAKIVVDTFQNNLGKLIHDIKSPDNTSCTNYVEEDRITYISGSKECIDFNYIWWSGKMWRITAIYPDGSIKIITDNLISAIDFNDTSTPLYYNNASSAKSLMFQWLNEDFLDTLYNHGEDVIDKTKYWNMSTIENEETIISALVSPIGLLNTSEYRMSYKSLELANVSNPARSDYLNINYAWWALNYTSGSSHVMCIDTIGDFGYKATNDGVLGVRPSIYLKPNVIMSGNGTKNKPYRLLYDYGESTQGDNLYTRHSGEYIKFYLDTNSDNNSAPLYRIVGVEGEDNNKKTKIVAMDFATYNDNGSVNNTKRYASTVTFGANENIESNEYWDYYLNHDWYNSLLIKNKIESGTYYIGSSSTNYKLAICAISGNYTTSECLIDPSKRVTTYFEGNVGLLRLGEMFATQQGSGYNNSISMWLITKYSSSYIHMIDSSSVSSNYSHTNYNRPDNLYGVRPSMYLKSTVKILSGSGTELDPYIVD